MEENKENLQPEQSHYEPRPMWQVWAARIGLVLFIGVVLYQILSIATGGM